MLYLTFIGEPQHSLTTIKIYFNFNRNKILAFTKLLQCIKVCFAELFFQLLDLRNKCIWNN